MFYSERESLAWLGGLFDGEGCLSLRINKNRNWGAIVFQFRMTDKDSLDTASHIISKFLKKKCNVLGPYKTKNKPQYKDLFCLDVTNRNDVYALIVAIWPYVNERRKSKFKEFIDWYKTTNYHNKTKKVRLDNGCI